MKRKWLISISIFILSIACSILIVFSCHKDYYAKHFTLSYALVQTYSNSNFIIANYIGLFDGDEKRFLLTTIPYLQMNRLYIAFAQIKTDPMPAYLDYNDPVNDPNYINTIIHNCMNSNKNVQIFISCGYNGWDDYHKAAENPSDFANSVVNFIKNNVVTVLQNAYLLKNIVVGFDMDLESSQTTVNDVTILVQALRNRFDQEYTSTGVQYLLTVTPWCPSYDQLDWKTITPLINQVNLMYTYQKNADQSLPYIHTLYDKGVNYNKIILGIQSENPLDSPQTLDDKCTLIQEYQLGGMMNWRVDNDTNHDKTFSYAKRMYSNLNGL